MSLKYFLHSKSASQRTQVRTWGCQVCFLPWAPSNLVTPLVWRLGVCYIFLKQPMFDHSTIRTRVKPQNLPVRCLLKRSHGSILTSTLFIFDEHYICFQMPWDLFRNGLQHSCHCCFHPDFAIWTFIVAFSTCPAMTCRAGVSKASVPHEACHVLCMINLVGMHFRSI